jgi:DNA-binding transcriptional LysR family regulator
MPSIRLEAIDLNLLKLFIALAETGSVTRAAAQIGLTQPSASNALGRLRLTLADPLFVRSNGQMVPTRFAVEIIPLVRSALSTLIEGLNRATVFEPAQSDRCFRLSLSGLGEAVFLPSLVRELTRLAPKVTLLNEPMPITELASSLVSGRTDIALGLVALSAPGIRTTPLYRETYVAIAAPDRRDVPRSIEELGSERLMLAAPAATYGQEIQSILGNLGLAQNIALTMQEFAALPELLQIGPYLAIVPGKYGESLARAGRARLLPFALGQAETQVNMVWSAHSEADAGSRWFRGVVERALVPQAAASPAMV